MKQHLADLFDHLFSLCAALALVITLAAAPVPAQVLEEVVVTAQKREQNIQDVGISITAFTGDQLKQMGVANSRDVAAITPGVENARTNGGYTSSFSIRGLTQADFGLSQEAPVALYVDEVYQSTQGMGDFLLFDVDRVEVLRGPQGTLFGRNATGGLVHFVTRKPSQQTEVYGELTFGSYNQVRFEGAAGGGLSETLSARASVSVNFHDDIVENRVGPDAYDADEQAGRIMFSFEPNDDLSILVNVHGGQMDNDNGWYDILPAKPTGFQGTGVPIAPDEDFFGTCAGCDAFGFREPDDDPYTVSHDVDIYHKSETYGVTGKVTWNLGNRMIVTSITDYTDWNNEYTEDSDGSDIQIFDEFGNGGEIFHFFGENEVDQFSQELRLSGETERTRWVTGFYYLKIDGDYEQGGTFPGFFAAIGFGGVNAQQTEYTLETESWSVFGQLEYDLSENFTVIGGLRYIDESKEQDYISDFKTGRDGFIIPFGLTSPNLITFNGSQEEGLWSAKAELDWNVSEDILAFVSFNRGIKAGGFNAPLDPSGAVEFIDPFTFDPAPDADTAFRYDEEILNAYEIGIKSTLMNGLARFNLSGFYYDYNDYQAFNLVGLTSFLQNTDAEIKGFEAELFASPVKGLDIVLGASFLDQEAKDVRLGTAVVDRDIPNSPEWSVVGMARYEWPAFGGMMALQGDFNYRSSQNFSLSNAEVTENEGYALGNARLSYRTSDERWGLAVFVKNISDKAYNLTIFDLAGFNGTYENVRGLPRWVGGTISYSY